MALPNLSLSSAVDQGSDAFDFGGSTYAGTSSNRGINTGLQIDGTHIAIAGAVIVAVAVLALVAMR